MLLIITNGAIEDIDETVDQLVEGSDLPLSIIIVGVGNAEFEMMEKLDADVNPLKSKTTGMYQKRDMVQFVPFNKFKGNMSGLAQEVLKELPKQMTNYFQSKKISPNIKKSRVVFSDNLDSYYQGYKDRILAKF